MLDDIITALICFVTSPSNVADVSTLMLARITHLHYTFLKKKQLDNNRHVLTIRILVGTHTFG